MSKYVRSALSVIALMFLSVSMALGQLSTATMFGTVTDATGAAVPRASVTLTQTETGFTRTIVAKEDGSYRADFLPVGPYKISAAAPGFKAYDRTGITLTVTEEAKVDLPLAVGDAGQTVEVTAELPLVNTGNSILGRTVDNVEIDNLPLVDRNVYTLLDLTPGVQNNNANGSGASGGVINPLGYPEQHVKINGSTDSAVGQISYYLDGGSNMTGLRNTGNPLPNPDAIREFRVETNNFSAQFGRSSGGVVTVITKSGSNSVHGSLFEFYRTKNFNAQLHNVAPSTGKSPYNQHRFGGTIGGPIHKDKTFFFASAGGFRFVAANLLTSAVPSAAMQQGNFSENLPTGTALTGTAACASTVGSSATRFYVCRPTTGGARTAYAGNIVPVTDFDPAIYNVIKAGLIPTPNPTLASDSAYTRRDFQKFSQQTDEQLGKIDHQLTSKQRLSLSYFHQNGDYVVNPSGNNVLGWSIHDYKFLQHNANVQHVWTLTNNTVNQLFFGYTRLIGGRIASPAESLAVYGSKFAEQLPDGTICGAQAQTGCSRPQLQVTGWFQAGQAITGPVTGNNVYLLRDVVSSTHGKHTMFFGAEGTLEKDAQQVGLNNYGVFQFTQAANGTATRSSAAISDFFLGRPNQMQQDVPVYANANYYNYGGFFQDDWRVTPTLTVNLGVRYDVQTAPTDTQSRQLNFDITRQSTVVPSAPQGVLFVGDSGVPRGGASTKYDHISPRVGFAWNPFGDGKTVFHGAAGIFFGTVGGNLFNYPSNGLPFSGRPVFKKVISVADPYTGDPSEFCANPAGGCTVGTSPYPYIYSPNNVRFIVRPSQIIAFDKQFEWPEVYQMNLGFQQQLGRSFVLTANGVASLSRKIPSFNDINYPIFGGFGQANTTATVDNRRPFNSVVGTSANPAYSNVYIIRSSESANYEGLQISAEERFSKNFSLRGFYVWSKNLQSEDLDTAGNTGNNAISSPQDQNFKFLDRQRSEFDQRHVATINFVFKSQFGIRNRTLSLLANGWTVTSIIRVQSGNPFNITTGADNNVDGVTNDRPNLAPGFTRATVTDNGGSRTAMQANWVSGTQFCASNLTTTTGGVTSATVGTGGLCPAGYGAGPSGIDGTVRAFTLDGPGRRDVDASLFRDFKVYERLRFQLRAEANNVFNLTNLANPTSTLSSATGFGKINGTIQFGTFSNRVLQVGGRILF